MPRNRQGCESRKNLSWSRWWCRHNENTQRTDPYALLNVRMGYDHRPWNLRAFFEARNLADASYISAVSVNSAIGRFVQPGDGRAFYGGIEWRWM